MKVLSTALPGVSIIEPDVHRDERGFFLETYQYERYAEVGIGCVFVQDNHSFSRRGTLRGLHLQVRRPQAKLIRVVEGEIFDVVVDPREDREHFGRWVGTRLSGENFRQLFVPAGLAHGFCVLSEQVHLEYKCSQPYDPDAELTIRWDDPKIGIEWPLDSPVLSSKDADGLSLAEAAARLRSDGQAR